MTNTIENSLNNISNKNLKFEPLEKIVIEVVKKNYEIKGFLGFTWQNYYLLVKSSELKSPFLLETNQESYLRVNIGDKFKLPVRLTRDGYEYSKQVKLV